MVEEKFKLLILITLLFIILVLKSGYAQPSGIDCSIYNATEYEQIGQPSYNLVMEPHKLSINPGDELIIYVYFPGEGVIEESFFNFYMDTDVHFDFGKCGKPFEGGSFNRWGWMKLPLEFFYCSYKDEATISERDCYLKGKETPAVTVAIKVYTTPKTTGGDHTIKGVFSYKDSDGNWHTSEDTKKFHVHTWWERLYYSSALIIAISSLAVSFVSLTFSLKRKKTT